MSEIVEPAPRPLGPRSRGLPVLLWEGVAPLTIPGAPEGPGNDPQAVQAGLEGLQNREPYRTSRLPPVPAHPARPGLEVLGRQPQDVALAKSRVQRNDNHRLDDGIGRLQEPLAL